MFELALEKKIISLLCLLSARVASCVRLGRRKFRFHRISNLLSDFALDRENICHVAIVGLGPEMRIGPGIDELHVDAHFVAGFLHTAFENGRDAELLRNCLQIFRLALVFRGRSARDHFQIGDARELGQDFILNAVGEISGALVVTQIFEWQHRNRFLRDG